MAAVLCGGIGKCISGCCDCVGQVCMAPFKICGACCEGCGQCCQDSCRIVTSCCSSSLCFYITVTCLLNLPPIVLGLTDLPNLVSSGCQASIWMLIYWLLCATHIVAAFYMARAIEQDSSILPSQQQQQQGMSHFDASSGAGRMKQLFCYDGWMAVYILVLCGFVVWLCLGAGVFLAEDQDNDECDSSVGTVGIAYGFGWAFVFVGGCALCCSLCCGILFKPGGNSSSTPFVNTQQQQPASSTSPKPNASSVPPTVTPVAASAPVEVPVASAEPIYDNDAPTKSTLTPAVVGSK